VLVGPTGVGKTGLAYGILLKALQNGLRCQFIRAQDPRLDILLIDEMGYANLNPDLGGHLKSGQWRSPENRPKETALRTRVVYNLLDLIRASIFSTAPQGASLSGLFFGS
jgi:hypothetical protein